MMIFEEICNDEVQGFPAFSGADCYYLVMSHSRAEDFLLTELQREQRRLIDSKADVRECLHDLNQSDAANVILAIGLSGGRKTLQFGESRLIMSKNCAEWKTTKRHNGGYHS